MVDFSDNSVIGLADYFLDDVVGSTGPFNVNTIVNVLTNSTGTINLSTFISGISTSIPLGAFANLTIGLEDISLSGLNTWSRLDLLKPVDKHSLASQTKTDTLDFKVSFFLNATSPSFVIAKKAQVLFNLRQSELNCTLQLAVDGSRVEALSMSSDSWTTVECFLETLEGANIIEAEVNTVVQRLTVSSENASASASLELR
jgi:hypothetical protein